MLPTDSLSQLHIIAQFAASASNPADVYLQLRFPLQTAYSGRQRARGMSDLAYAAVQIDGMRMDLVKPRYETFDELYEYCYKVAGTVGLMTTPVMGVDPAYKVC